MAFYNSYNPYGYTGQPYNAMQYQQPQQGGVIPVRSEAEARNYPVAPGNSVIFKDENAPYIYIKTMGVSQFDTPRFDKYRLQKEEAAPVQTQQGETYALRSELAAVAQKLAELENAIKGGANSEQPV